MVHNRSKHGPQRRHDDARLLPRPTFWVVRTWRGPRAGGERPGSFANGSILAAATGENARVQRCGRRWEGAQSSIQRFLGWWIRRIRTSILRLAPFSKDAHAILKPHVLRRRIRQWHPLNQQMIRSEKLHGTCNAAWEHIAQGKTPDFPIYRGPVVPSQKVDWGGQEGPVVPNLRKYDWIP